MKLKPINNNVCLKEENRSEVTLSSGIQLFVGDSNKTGFFFVHSIGENEWGLKPGDKVLASKYAGEEVEIKEGDEKILLKVCNLDTISAIVDE